MPSDELYRLLAEAKSRPSGAYRVAKAALDVPEQAIKGYMSGSELADKIKERRVQNSLLSDLLGVNTPEGLKTINVREANAIVKPVEAYATLLKAKKEQALKDARAQQANFLLNGNLMEYDPDKGYYPARIEGKQASNATVPVSPLNITPRVAPTIPTTESDKLADLNSMKEAVGVARKNFSPDFVGPINARKLALSQTVNAPSLGLGATGKGALFTQSVQDLKDRLLRARSGAQINEQEYNRLVALVPDQYKSVPDFLTKLDRFNQVLDSTISSKRQELMRAGYRGASSLPNNRPNSSFDSSNTPTFDTPEEAETSGYKGPAIIAGRKAIIH